MALKTLIYPNECAYLVMKLVSFQVKCPNVDFNRMKGSKLAASLTCLSLVKSLEWPLCSSFDWERTFIPPPPNRYIPEIKSAAARSAVLLKTPLAPRLVSRSLLFPWGVFMLTEMWRWRILQRERESQRREKCGRQLFPLVSLKRPWRWRWKDKQWRDGKQRQQLGELSIQVHYKLPPPLALIFTCVEDFHSPLICC